MELHQGFNRPVKCAGNKFRNGHARLYGTMRRVAIPAGRIFAWQPGHLAWPVQVNRIHRQNQQVEKRLSNGCERVLLPVRRHTGNVEGKVIRCPAIRCHAARPDKRPTVSPTPTPNRPITAGQSCGWMAQAYGKKSRKTTRRPCVT